MTQFRLPDETHVAHVHLRVRELGPCIDFYTGIVGLKVASQSGPTAHFTAQGLSAPLLTLTEDRTAKPRDDRKAGLFHTAFLFPSRRDLAQALRRVASRRYGIDGASDHRVSQAIYLPDPEGNGVELYTDRPRSEWPLLGDGYDIGQTRSLDLNALLEESLVGPDETGAPPGTTIGHVHLRVTDLPAAETFFHTVAGLDVTFRMRGAVFLSAGGYHHHLAVNTWGSPAPAAPGAAGLVSYRFEVPRLDALGNLSHRASSAGYEAVAAKDETGADLLRLRDPNGLSFEVGFSAHRMEHETFSAGRLG
jgi:catechol 2,3-dioxygenase